MNLVARRGIGKQHAKWSPVATCSMRKRPLVQLKEEIVNSKYTLAQR